MSWRIPRSCTARPFRVCCKTPCRTCGATRPGRPRPWNLHGFDPVKFRTSGGKGVRRVSSGHPRKPDTGRPNPCGSLSGAATTDHGPRVAMTVMLFNPQIRVYALMRPDCKAQGTGTVIRPYSAVRRAGADDERGPGHSGTTVILPRAGGRPGRRGDPAHGTGPPGTCSHGHHSRRPCRRRTACFGIRLPPPPGTDLSPHLLCRYTCREPHNGRVSTSTGTIRALQAHRSFPVKNAGRI